jgi:hypothetical protein
MTGETKMTQELQDLIDRVYRAAEAHCGIVCGDVIAEEEPTQLEDKLLLVEEYLRGSLL